MRYPILIEEGTAAPSLDEVRKLRGYKGWTVGLIDPQRPAGDRCRLGCQRPLKAAGLRFSVKARAASWKSSVR